MSVHVEIPRSRRAAALRGAPALGWGVLALLLIAGAVLLLYETRGTELWFDDWIWVMDRRAGGLGTFLDPHNGHLSLVPVAIYKLLFASVGIDSYAPFRVVMVVAHLAVVALLFAYARRRVGDVLALCVAALILLFGPAWQNFMWPFNVSWLIPLAAGIGALLALDRRDRRGDAVACALLVLALASAAIGVPVAIGVAVEVVLTRARRQWWVAAVPIALYALWWIGWQDTGAVALKQALVNAPRYVAEAAAGTASALTGLSGDTVPQGAGSVLDWGPPLAILAVAGVLWRVRRIGVVSARVWALAAMLGSFWVLTAVSRAFISPPYASRYLYVAGLFAVLLAVELGRGVAIGRRAGVAAAALTAIVVLSNLGPLREAGAYLRTIGADTRADLAAAAVGRPAMPPGYVLHALPGYPFAAVDARRWFATARDIGSPGASPAELPRLPAHARATADRELIAIHDVRLRPAGPGDGLGPCLRNGPQLTAPLPPPRYRELPPKGAVVSARGGPATVAVRRYGGEFVTVGTVAGGSQGLLRIERDASAVPWQLRVSGGRADVCTLL